MSEPKSTQSSIWLLVAGITLTAGGTLGLSFLDIRWNMLVLVWGFVVNGVQLVATGLRMLFTADYFFSGSLLAFLLGVSSLIAALYLRYFRRLNAHMPAPTPSAPVVPSRLVSAIHYGWPVVALVVTFCLALARGTTDEFLKDAAQKGLTFLGSMLIVVPIVLLVIFGSIALDARKRK
jgi:hypothetical protein